MELETRTTAFMRIAISFSMIVADAVFLSPALSLCLRCGNIGAGNEQNLLFKTDVFLFLFEEKERNFTESLDDTWRRFVVPCVC